MRANQWRKLFVYAHWVPCVDGSSSSCSRSSRLGASRLRPARSAAAPTTARVTAVTAGDTLAGAAREREAAEAARARHLGAAERLLLRRRGCEPRRATLGAEPDGQAERRDGRPRTSRCRTDPISASSCSRTATRRSTPSARRSRASPSYVPLQQAAEKANQGLWGACAADLSVELEAMTAAVAVGDDDQVHGDDHERRPARRADVDLDVRAPQGNPFDTAASESSARGLRAARAGTRRARSTASPRTARRRAFFTVEAKKEGAVSATALVRISGCIRDRVRQPAAARLERPERPQRRVHVDRPAAAARSSRSCRRRRFRSTTGSPAATAIRTTRRSASRRLRRTIDCADLSFRGFQVLARARRRRRRIRTASTTTSTASAASSTTTK